MYSIEDLFDKRSVVGVKLEKIIIERGFTKVELSENVGISRPTLNKVLTGTLTNKTNYEKHMSKILHFLSVSPDMLLGNMRTQYTRTREIRSLMKIKTKEIAKATGIPFTRLMGIEAGEDATIAELRDIAMCLSVSVNCLLGKNFFESQIGKMDPLVGANDRGYSGFWGHIGVQLRNRKNFLWFPIAGEARAIIYRMRESKRIVVPCMNNKVLFLNMENVNEIILLDDACDQPEDINWDSGVDCGEIPLVMYEALSDYAYEQENLSFQLCETIKKWITEKGWSQDDIDEIIGCSQIYYVDGENRQIKIDFMQDKTIVDEVYSIYGFEDSEFAEDILSAVDYGGGERIFNMKNIAMMELPLLLVEEAIYAIRCEEGD